MTTVTLSALERASKVVRKVFGPTPSYRYPLLCERVGADVWVKHENHTPTGSFKIRGGLTYLAKHTVMDNCQGIIAASTGNHGQSVAVASALYGVQAVIVVPSGNSPSKNALMRSQGAELVEYGADFQDALNYAEEIALRDGFFMMPSFDEVLIEGVGTYALELFHQVCDLRTIYVPVGLGSGICGVISARDALGLSTEVVGVVATGAPCYQLSFTSKKIVTTDSVHTMAAGVACREPVEEALNTIWTRVERIVAVSDAEIRHAIGAYFNDTHNVVEGAGACSLAAVLKEREKIQGHKIAMVLSGGNIDRADLASILSN